MYEITVTPRFGDIDGLKHVNNNKIVDWFELARNDIFRFFTPNLSLEDKDWKLILVHNEANFVNQTRFGKEVTILSYILRVGNTSFITGDEAWQDGELKAKGKSVVVNFNFMEQHKEPIPEDVKEKLKEHLISEDEIANDCFLNKGKKDKKN